MEGQMLSEFLDGADISESVQLGYLAFEELIQNSQTDARSWITLDASLASFHARCIPNKFIMTRSLRVAMRACWSLSISDGLQYLRLMKTLHSFTLNSVIAIHIWSGVLSTVFLSV
jgi:hypothetical protein